MNRTVLIVLAIIALLILVGIIALNFINNQDDPQPTPVPGTEGTPAAETTPQDSDEAPTITPSLVQVVVSLQTVPRGHRMTEDILTYDLRKESEVPGNVITDMDDAISMFARTDIFQGETLTVDALVDDPTIVGLVEFGPSSLIPQGFLAMGVPIQDELAGIAFAIDEGDYVDILISFDLYQIDEEFQTYLENDIVFFVENAIVSAGELLDDIGSVEATATPVPVGEAVQETELDLVIIRPFGRIEELANGDQAFVGPREPIGRPIHIGLVLQNAKVIQVGPYTLPSNLLAQLPTPTPEPAEEGAETPTPGPAQVPTSTPEPPATLVVALAPQQQLLLKHAIEVGAEIDFALRGSNDNQLYPVDNVDLGLLLELFGIEIPPNFNYTLDSPSDDEGTIPGSGNSSGSGGASTPESQADPTTTPGGS